ncbi:hypothetical protein ACFSYG_17675 [Leeuwenhoekiella polynyae]|uniref:Uncharacterized protein n=1 Tax=Leeuwenhoekiella polynyae TaxID=1550906 RepID=A0A4Q0P788_9FLAO|nr:hypothetical protein [Leeuwenhoekiella polynyae]RXG22315.1 hypothetical protein DSM02_1915 [Leeuwenhoekiella polynyae]
MHQKKSKKAGSLSLLTGSLIAAFIVASPYFFYLYEGFPKSKIWETSFFGLTLKYESINFVGVDVVAWIVFSKAIPMLLFLIWFLTCKHWWYHAILVPICMYFFQIVSTFNDDLAFADSVDIYYMAPIILVALIFMYTIRMKIFDRIHNIDLSELKRVSLKGEIKDEDELTSPYSSTDEDDDEPLFMG